MQSSGQDILKNLLSKRSSLVELLLTIIVIALGINLISGGIQNIIGTSSFSDNLLSLSIGFVLCLFGIAYVVFRFLKERTKDPIYYGFIIYNKANKNLVLVDDYYLSKALSMYLSDAFSYINNMETLWKSFPLDNAYREDDRESMSILREALEFFVLEQLSFHLREFFKDRTKETRDFYYNDFHQILQTNRFIQLYTTPPSQRGGKVNSSPMSEESQLDIAEAQKRAKPFFLTLPHDSKIDRNKDRQVVINTSKCDITIDAHFGSQDGVTPPTFLKYKLGLNDDVKTESYIVFVQIKISFKLGILLNISGIKQYEWIDSFLERLDDNISQEKYFRSIEWNSVATIIQHLERINGQKQIPNPANKATEKAS